MWFDDSGSEWAMSDEDINDDDSEMYIEDDSGYAEHITDDSDDSDGWDSGGSEDQMPFQSQVQNVEIAGVPGDENTMNTVPPESDEDDEEDSGDEFLPVAPHLKLFLQVPGHVGRGSGAGWEMSSEGVEVVLLPEVVEAILLRLPAAAQARCRAVCKAWLAMLSSPDFLRRSFILTLSEMAQPLCAFSYSDEMYQHEGKGFRELEYKTLRVDLSFLPEVFHSRSTEFHSHSSSGLICLGREVYQTKWLHLCVVNPLNQSFKLLPPLHVPLPGAVAILIARSGLDTGFQVYVRRPRDDMHIKFMVYSSETGAWRFFEGRPNNELELRGAVITGLPMVCAGRLYTVVRSTRPRLVELNTGSGSRYLKAVSLPYFHPTSGDALREQDWLFDFFLADHRGTLLCCCGGIWALDYLQHQWVEIAGECPPELLPTIRKKHSLNLRTVRVAGDLVLFFYQVETRRGKSGTQAECPVAFNMPQRQWQRIPGDVARFRNFFEPPPALVGLQL